MDYDGHPVIRVVPMPCDTNPGGDIFGGWIMSQIDIAGAVVAIRRAQGKRIVTATVSSLDFHKPVHVGDLVSLYAEITDTGTTSITVHVDVFAERGRAEGEPVKVTQADLIYVAIDENRKPTPID